MGYRTKLDYSSNRQISQREKTDTILSGSTVFGLPFSALTAGPNSFQSGVTESYTSVVSVFSGNSTTTIYSWFDPRMELAAGNLSALTSLTSGVTQYTGDIFIGNNYNTIDGNISYTNYTGVSFTLDSVYIVELGGGAYSGTVQHLDLDFLSAASLDYSGRTIWVDNPEITRTNRLIITDNPVNGYVWTCIDSEGMGEWQYNGSSSGSTIWSAGTGVNSAVLGGSGAIASGITSVSEGYNTIAGGNYSHAEGYYTTASGGFSHTEGFFTTASGNYSHAQGGYTIASGQYSHAEGRFTTAIDKYSHAQGFQTTAYSEQSHAEGYRTTAIGIGSHAEGSYTVASGQTSHTEGFESTTIGLYSHAEGGYTVASGQTSHSEGDSTTAAGTSSHAEGDGTTAIGKTSHAEGDKTTAIGDYSHTEGRGTIASGTTSHAEGYGTTAIGGYSHSGGYNTIVDGNASFIHSYNSTITNCDYSGVFVGNNNIISGSSINSSIIGGEYNTISGHDSSAIIGGTYNTIHYGVAGGTEGKTSETILGGYYNTISASSYSTILGGQGNEIIKYDSSAILGGVGNRLIDYWTDSYTGSVDSGFNKETKYSTIIGGVDNAMTGKTAHCTILGGSGNTINGYFNNYATYDSAIIGGLRNQVGLTVNRSIVLGGSDITATTSDTVYAPNINIDNQENTYSSKLGINTSSPSYPLDVRGSNVSRIYYSPTSPIGGVLTISATTGIPMIGVNVNSGIYNQSGGISMGVRGWDDVSYPSYGKQGDSHLYSSQQSNGLNIISSDGVGTEDYIRFWVGGDCSAPTSMAMNIVGSGSSLGYIGINTLLPTERLHVNGSLKVVDGTQQDGYVFTSNASGKGSWQENPLGAFMAGKSPEAIVTHSLTAKGIPEGQVITGYTSIYYNTTDISGTLTTPFGTFNNSTGLFTTNTECVLSVEAWIHLKADTSSTTAWETGATPTQIGLGICPNNTTDIYVGDFLTILPSIGRGLDLGTGMTFRVLSGASFRIKVLNQTSRAYPGSGVVSGDYMRFSITRIA